MDTEILVDNRIDDGRRLITELVRDGFDVTVAFWVRTSEEGLWVLYIGSTSVAAEKIGEAYGILYLSLHRIPDSGISLLDIKLVHATNPIAVAAKAIRDRYPGRVAIRSRGTRLGKLSVDEVYIYPAVTGPMTPDEVMQTVLRLMNRTGPVQPSVVTLRDGSAIQAIPMGIQMRQPGGVQIVLLDIATNTDRPVSADDVVNIQ